MPAPTVAAGVVTLTPSTDLSTIVNRRVRVERTVRGSRYTLTGVIYEAVHRLTSYGYPPIPYVGAMMRTEPNAYTPRAGDTSLWLDYEDTTIEPLT